MNPLYQQIMNPQPTQGQPINPMQRMSSLMQAMSNPAQFIRQAFPDIPDNISNNPGQILQYLQQTRGISNEQIRQITNQISQIQRGL